MDNKGLTVKELIEVLQGLPQDADVLTMHDLGDNIGFAYIYRAYVDKDGDVIIDNEEVG